MIAIPQHLRRLQERIAAAISHVALFPAIRLLESELARSIPVGSAADAGEERIHFSHPPTFTLPAGEILALDYASEDDTLAATVKTSLLGLLGSESPLSPGMSEEVLFEDDDALQCVYDLLHHRTLSLLYSAWRRYAPSASVEGAGADAYSQALLSMVGQDAFSPYEPAPSSVDPMFTLGLSDFTRCDPSFLDVSGLEQLLRRVFPELNARVAMSEPRVVKAAPEDRSRLGVQRSILGAGASYGSSALDASGVVRIHVGPVDRATYEGLLPGGPRYRQMQPLVETWLASRAIAELDILLPAPEAPALRLGRPYGGKLGRDAQYRARDTRSVRARVSLLADSAEAVPDYADETSPPELANVAPLVESPPPSARVRPDGRWKAALALLRGGPLPSAVQSVVEVASRVAAMDAVDAALDLVIRALDDAASAQVDAVLHDPAFQALEARWRGLEYVTRLTPEAENIQVTVFACSKEELVEDLQESTELVKSRAFDEIYTRELGTFGGEPYGAILADMEFDASARDVALLRQMSALATMAHAPFFAAASPALLQLGSWRDLPSMREGTVRVVIDGSTRVGWNSLRDSDDSRAAGLLIGRPLHRVPYGSAPIDATFPYSETIAADGEGLLFGNPIYVLATRLASSFARHRTLAALVGDDQDVCPAPASLAFPSLGAHHRRPGLEVTVTPRLERELRDVGLIALAHRKQTPHVYLPSANSLQRPRTFGTSDGGHDATLSHLLGTKFQYFCVACRFAHYIKVLERETAGAHRSAKEIEQSVSQWLANYAIVNAASVSLRARYPLRSAKVVVSEIEGAPGWHRGEIQIRPHLRYLDRFFTLSVKNWVPPKGGGAPPVSRPWESKAEAPAGDE